MTNTPVVVGLTRRLPASIEAQLASRYDLRLPASEAARSRLDIRALLATTDVLVCTVADPIGSADIPDAPRTRLIANYGVGVNHIDLEAARARGIIVTNTPGVLTDATAELAITLMLMVARRAGEGERQLRAGHWTGWEPTHLPGMGLTGRVLGIVGMGRIGSETARRAACGLGMSVRYYSRSSVAPERLAGFNAERVMELDELVRSVDVLSLHCPLTPETYHLMDARRLELMQPHALVINTSRGAVIDEPELAAALARGQLAGCGLDVYEQEPRVHPGLLRSERAVLLPHMGSATVEARTAMGHLVLENIAAWERGQQPPNLVN
ncbi:MAG TPA: D-glycerate dehydrogenase [Gemmatimonadales bacterium]|jgi:lactate dehydrogenase-like 2-hydroxyacid dehydrogenase|nr:D-glycerate dehydrogenase [Gemmatimonadales bacterium]